MANSWLRLWHEMPNDPKWRTISRISKQPVATVQAVFIHLLVSASRNVTRGHFDVTEEDLASALDVTEQDIQPILDAMQGRVLDGDYVSGWDKRQVMKEDNGNTSNTAKTPAERKRQQREREKLRASGHEESRQVTDGSRGVTTDTDTDTDKELKDPPLPPKGNQEAKSEYSPEFEEAWSVYPRRAGGNSKQAAFKAWNARIKSGVAVEDMVDGVKRYAAYIVATGKIQTEYVQQAATFFGRSCHYENEWQIPKAGGGYGRDVNQISPPDNEIPDGFRG